VQPLRPYNRTIGGTNGIITLVAMVVFNAIIAGECDTPHHTALRCGPARDRPLHDAFRCRVILSSCHLVSAVGRWRTYRAARPELTGTWCGL
jgi:hypothetical protein